MAKSAIIDALRSQIDHVERGFVERQHAVLPAPSAQLLAFLPDDGLRLGSFIEIIEAVPGSRGLSLALLLAKHLQELRPRWAVFDHAHSFNAVAASCAGWSVEHLSLIRADVSHAAWVFSQLLKSREIGLSIASLPNMDNMVFRRFQLSAERGEGLGVIVRPLDALKRPCWSSLRLLVEPLNSERVRVSLVHARGTPSASSSIEVAL